MIPPINIDNKLFLDILDERFRKESGRRTIDLYEENKQLRKEIDELKSNKKKFTKRRGISVLLKLRKNGRKIFRGKQAELLRILSRYKQVEGRELEKRIDTESLKSLIYDTRDKIRDIEGGEVVKINMHRAGQRLRYYSLEIILSTTQ